MRQGLLNFFSPYSLNGLARSIGLIALCLLAALKMPPLIAVPTGFVLASVLMGLTRRFRLLRQDLRRLPKIRHNTEIESIKIDVSLCIERFSVGRVVRSFGQFLYMPPRGTSGTIESIYLCDDAIPVVLKVRWRSGLATLIRASDLEFADMSVFADPHSIKAS